MKRPFQMFTLATMTIVAFSLVSLAISSANGNKRSVIETGDFAFVDVFSLIDLSLSTEEMSSEREVFTSKSATELTALQQQYQGLQSALSTMQQTDPNAGTIYNQLQQAQFDFETASQQYNADYQTLIAKQLARSYSSIYEAANAVGQQEGFTFVMATRSDGELIQSDTITGITQEILARPLLTPPGSVDLTEQVRLELGYPTKEEAEAIQEAAREAAEAAAQGGSDDESAPAETTEESTDDAAEEVDGTEMTEDE
jgi:Skp family chaperone for outer membrane proteins